MSPLRYPGAKRWMSGYISRAIDSNNLFPDLFVEPFAGGASVSLAQLHAGLVEKVILSDRDPLIASFWKTVFFDSSWLIDQVWDIEVTMESWNFFKKQHPTSDRARALKCLFLNRTSFSGILCSKVGPIGGKAQKSKYKVDCRFTKETVIRRIETIAAYRKRVAGVWNLNWRAAISQVQRMQKSGSLPKRSFFYLDPPFYKQGSSLYPVHFCHSQHVDLRNFLLTFDDPWILSYDMCSEVAKLYKDGGFHASSVSLIYTASHNGNRGIGKEFIVSNLSRMVSELQLGAATKTSGRIHISRYAQDKTKQVAKREGSARTRVA